MNGYRPSLTLALFVALVCAPLAAAQDQSLAAAAKRERDRRAKVSKPVKVLTEEDGKETAAKGAGSLTTLSGSAGSDTPPVAPAPGVPIETQRAEWKAKADALRSTIVTHLDDIERMKADVEAFRSDIAPLSAQEAQDPLRIQKREQTIAAMNAEIEKKRVLLEDAKKALSELEQDARRNNIPAGWLR